VKPDREGLEWPGMKTPHRRGDARRVKPTRQEDAERDVRHQVAPNRIVKSCTNRVDAAAFVVQGRIGIKEQLPVALDFYIVTFSNQEAARRKLARRFVDRRRRWDVGQG